jgi:hypothetical protein
MQIGLNNLGLTGLRPIPFSLSTIFSSPSTPGLWLETYDPNALYPRRNQFTYSEFTGGNGFTASANAVLSAMTGYDAAVAVTQNGSSNVDVFKSPTVAVGDKCVFRFVVTMDDGAGPPVYVAGGAAAANDFQVFLQGVPDSVAATVTALSAGQYQVVLTFTAAVSTGVTGIRKLMTNSARSFKTSGWQFERYATAYSGSYQKVTDWNTEYLASTYSVTPSNARRNLLTWTEDTTNAVWTFANVTVVHNVADPNGGTAATRITATADSSTGLFQQVSGSNSVQAVNSCMMRRVSGTSAVYISNPFGGTTDISSQLAGGSWVPISSVPAIANGGLYTFEILLSLTGDAIEFAFPQTEVGSTPTAYQKITDGTMGTFIPPAIHYTAGVTEWQDSGFNTPDTAINQTIGGWMDKRMSIGSEINGDPTYQTPAYWTAQDSSVSVSGGVYTMTAANGNFSCDHLMATLPIGLYQVTYTIQWISSGTVSSYIGGGIGVLRSSAGTYAEYVWCNGANTAIALRADATVGTNAVITFFSVKAVAGNHLIQSTTTTRPVLSARVNLLTKTEQFTDAVWAKSFAGTGTSPVVTDNYAVSPRGDMTAARLQTALHGGGSSSGNYSLLASASPPSGGAGNHFTGAIYVKSNTLGNQNVLVYLSGSSAVSKTVVQVTPNTWTRISPADYATDAGTVTLLIGARGNAVTFGGDDVLDILIWGADIRFTADTAKGYPEYQRVNTASDYDTLGFAFAPRFDGVDDALATASLSPGTLTNNMDAFLLFRRLNNSKAVSAYNGSTTGYFGVFDPATNGLTTAGVGSAYSNFVDGNAVADDRIALATAIPVGSWHVLEVRNLDLSGAPWTQFAIGGYTGFPLGGEIAAVVLCPAQSSSVRQQIRAYLGNKVGLSL